MLRRSSWTWVVALMVIGASSAESADIYWVPASGDWSAPDNWDLLRLPTSLDNPMIDNGGTATVTSSAEADYAGVGGSGSRLVLSDGSLNLAYGLNVGGSSGTPCEFEMTGGTLICSDLLRVGTQYNTPTIAQSGGTAITDTLHVGIRYTYGQRATYNLSGTAVLYSRESLVGGDWGTGHFYQYGGTHIVTEDLTVGYKARAYDSYYELDAGTLSTGATFIGSYNSEGTFRQNGGVLSAGFLGVKSGSTYVMQGGQLSALDSSYVAGTFDLGSNLTSVAVGGIANFSGAEILGGQQTAFFVGPDSLAILPADFDPATRLGSFANSGLVVYSGSGVDIPEGRTVRGSGTVAEHVYCAGALLQNADYTVPEHAMVNDNSITLTRGIMVDGGTVHLGQSAKLTVNNEVSGITGGELQTHIFWMGHNADARFVQTGGAVVANEMLLGMGNFNHLPMPQVSYEISDGSLAIANDLEVDGYRSHAVFSQTGGNVSVGDWLWIGTSNDDPQGTYRIRGGALTASGVTIAAGQSTGTLEIVGADPVINLGSLHMSDDAQMISHVEAEGLAAIAVATSAELDGTWRVFDDGAPLGRWNVITAGTSVESEWTVELPDDTWSWGIENDNTVWLQHVPEPSTFILLAIGVACLPVLRLRRRWR